MTSGMSDKDSLVGPPGRLPGVLGWSTFLLYMHPPGHVDDPGDPGSPGVDSQQLETKAQID